MGLEWIYRTIAALQAAGIRTAQSYPAGRMPQLTGPVCTVGLQKWQPGQTCTLSVQVYAPPEQSGDACQSLAAQAAWVLEQQGAKCSVGPCAFETKTGLFTAQVLAEWSETKPGFSVRVGQTFLDHVTGLQASRDRNLTRPEEQAEEGAKSVDRDGGWRVTITEQLPLTMQPEADETGTFDVIVSTDGGVVCYPNCRWDELRYTPTAAGLIRQRTARTWEERQTEFAIAE